MPPGPERLADPYHCLLVGQPRVRQWVSLGAAFGSCAAYPWWGLGLVLSRSDETVGHVELLAELFPRNHPVISDEGLDCGDQGALRNELGSREERHQDLDGLRRVLLPLLVLSPWISRLGNVGSPEYACSLALVSAATTSLLLDFGVRNPLVTNDDVDDGVIHLFHVKASRH